MGALLTKCLNFSYQNLISKVTERFIHLNFLNICKFLCDSLAKTHFVFRQIKKNVKSVPLQAWSGPEGSRKLRFSRFRDNSTGWW